MAQVSAVLDTNVIVSGVLFGGKPAKLLEYARNHKYQAIISLYILGELRDILENKCNIPRELVNETVEELALFCEIVPVMKTKGLWVHDQKDNPVIETALYGKTDYLVTGDKRLLSSKTSVKIITVKLFLEQLDSQS